MYAGKIIPTGPSLVVLVGPSGAGKSHFANEHFEAHEIVSTDALRVELTGDMQRQDKNREVIAEFHRRIAVKIEMGQRVVADATHVKDRDRRATAEIGIMLDVPVTYVVIDRPLEAKLQTGGWRLEIQKEGKGLIEAMDTTFKANETKILNGDSFAGVKVVDTRIDIFKVARSLPRDSASVRPWLRSLGFERLRVIGDVHGNLEGFEAATATSLDTFFLFLGDIVDYDSRGVRIAEEVAQMMRNGTAACIRGNHESKISRWVIGERGEGFRGNISHGNDATTNVVKSMTPGRRAQWEANFLGMVEMSPDWIQIDNWLFTHGAADPRMWGNRMFRAPKNSKLESLALYGQTTGEFVGGFPVRIYDWVDEIPARNRVMVGHAILSVEEPVVKTGKLGGEAIFLDTGSSKMVNHDNGEVKPPVKGHLSWADFDLASTGTVFRGFGRE